MPKTDPIPSFHEDEPVTERVVRGEGLEFSLHDGSATYHTPVDKMVPLVSREEMGERFGLVTEAVASINGTHLIARTPEGEVFLLAPTKDYQTEEGLIPIDSKDLLGGPATLDIDGDMAVYGKPYRLSVSYDKETGKITFVTDPEYVQYLNVMEGPNASPVAIDTAVMRPATPKPAEETPKPYRPPQKVYADGNGNYVRGHVAHGYDHPTHGRAVIQTSYGKAGIRQ